MQKLNSFQINLSGNSPEISTCFQHTILVLIPCLFFWLLFPILFLQTNRAKSGRRFLPLPLRFLLITKFFVSAILIVDAIFIFTRYFDDQNLEIPSPVINAIYPIILAVTAGGLFFGHFLCMRAGLVGSGIIFNSWFFFTLCGIPELITWIQKLIDESETSSNGRSAGFIIWWIGCLVQTLLFCFADKRQAKDPAGVEHRISFINHLFLYWFSPLPAIGAKRNLKQEDMFPLYEGHTAAYLENLWDHYWIPTMESKFFIYKFCKKKF